MVRANLLMYWSANGSIVVTAQSAETIGSVRTILVSASFRQLGHMLVFICDVESSSV
jgi:hypothetical protein